MRGEPYYYLGVGIREEFLEYTDADGLVQLTKNPERGSTQNGIRWTAQEFAILFKMNLITPEILQSFVSAMKTCEVLPGLYRRCSTRLDDQEGPDDYHCLIGVCKMLGLHDMARAVLDRGQLEYRLRDMYLGDVDPASTLGKALKFAIKYLGFIKLHYNYNNVNPGMVTTSSWMGRFPALVTSMKCAVGDAPSWFEWFYTTGSIVWSTTRPRTDQDARALTWFVIEAVKGRSWLCDLAISWWWHRFKIDFPGGMRQLLTEYCGNSDMPAAKYFVD